MNHLLYWTYEILSRNFFEHA